MASNDDFIEALKSLGLQVPQTASIQPPIPEDIASYVRGPQPIEQEQAPSLPPGPRPGMAGIQSLLMGAPSPDTAYPADPKMPSPLVSGAPQDTPFTAPKKPAAFEWNPAYSDEALQAARSAQNKGELFANLGNALSQGTATMTGTKANPAFYEGLAQQAKEPVNQIKEGREFQKMKMDSNSKALDLQEKTEAHDVDSKKSQMMRKVWSPVAQKIGITPDVFSNLSAADIDDVSKGILKLDEINQRAEDNRLKREQIRATRDTTIGTKNAENQNKALSKVAHDMETFRGNREVQQAAIDTYSAKKALKIVANNPHPTSQDVALLAQEMAKIATGGVPGEHGVQTLMPNTLRGKVAEFQSFISNKPSDAQAQEFIKKNMTYLKGMVDEANGVVKKYQRNTLEANKKLIAPEDYVDLRKRYELDDEPSEAPKSGGSDVEARIQKVIDANPGYTRDQVVRELKAAGKI